MTTSDNHKCGYVPILGRPNVGKSTLANSLLKFKLSVVTKKPQTTRHRALGILNGKDYQMILLDTPGILEPSYRLQEILVRTAMSTLGEGDVVLLMTEPKADAFADHSRLFEQIKLSRKPVVLAINKIDLVGRTELLPLIKHFTELFPFNEIVPISALKEDGMDHLKEVLAGFLPTGHALYPPDEITDRPERFFVAEMIRAKVFQLYGEEIPYSTAVAIEEFKERTPPAKNYIRAAVFVERDSQKGVIIGKGGNALKRLGRLVREDVETFLEREIYLELHVLVRDKWRRTDSTLRDLGYR
jgi:GTP-binding protein Era